MKGDEVDERYSKLRKETENKHKILWSENLKENTTRGSLCRYEVKTALGKILRMGLFPAGSR
jgi:hypothetical protein